MLKFNHAIVQTTSLNVTVTPVPVKHVPVVLIAHVITKS